MTEHDPTPPFDPRKPPQFMAFALDDRFAVTALIGRGGFATVYAAIDCNVQQRVAVKLPHSASRDSDARLYREFLWMLHNRRDGAATCGVPRPLGLYHPANGACFLVLERLQGATCEERLQSSGSFPLRRALVVVRSVARTAQRSNALGYVHRDIKPGNVFVCDARTGEAPRVVVLDGGNVYTPDQRITRPGEFCGTPGVMPREMLDAIDFDWRTDVFMVAALLLRLVTNHDPYEGSTFDEIVAMMRAATHHPPLDAISAAVSDGLRPPRRSSPGADTAKLPRDTTPLVPMLARALHPALFMRPTWDEFLGAIDDTLALLYPGA